MRGYFIIKTKEAKAMAKKRANNEGSITKRSDGRYMGQISLTDPITGKRKRKTLYGKSQKEVLEKINMLKYQLQTGVYTGESDITVGKWMITWLKEYKQNSLKKGTYTNYNTYINNHIIPNLGKIKLQDLRADQIQSFYNHLLKNGRKNPSVGEDKGLSPTTIKRIHILINSALKQAMKNGLITKNAASAVSLPKQIKHEIQPLSREEIQRLLKVAREDRLYAAFLLECGTGLRRGELVGLKWEDINFDNKTLQVKRSLVIQYDINAKAEGRKATYLEYETPKTEKSKRVVSIPENIITELKAHKIRQNEEKLKVGEYYNNEGLVFCNIDGSKLHPATLVYSFKRMLKVASIKDARFHDLRHSVATLLLEMNEHPKVVQELLGHSTITTTLDIYSHVSMEKKEQAAAKLNTIFK